MNYFIRHIQQDRECRVVFILDINLTANTVILFKIVEKFFSENSDNYNMIRNIFS